MIFTKYQCLLATGVRSDVLKKLEEDEFSRLFTAVLFSHHVLTRLWRKFVVCGLYLLTETSE